MITQAERTFALKQLDQSRKRLLQILEGLSPDQLSYHPGPERWSIAENIEHVVIVEKRVVGAIEKLLQDPPDTAKQSAISDAELVWQVGTVVEPLKSPDRSLPTLRWPAEVLLQEFENVRSHTREFTNSTTSDLRRHFIPHPYFADLDCYQWLLAIGAHCNRHSTQSEGVKTCRNFPS